MVRGKIVASRPKHNYTLAMSPKTVHEQACVLQRALAEYRTYHKLIGPTYDVADEFLQLLLDECNRKRPTGSDGKHGNLHTDECGC